MRHKHHIIPKHMGGTNDPSNIVELTVAEHADAHNLLYALHKHPYDKIAELALLEQIDRAEIQQELARVVGKSNIGRKHSDEAKAKMSTTRKGVPKSEETKAKMRATALANRENRSRAAKIGNEKRWRK